MTVSSAPRPPVSAPGRDVTNGVSLGDDLPWCLADEDRAWRLTVRDFAERSVEPTAAARYSAQRFDDELFSAAARLGIFELMVPEERGGSGPNVTAFCLAVEELARVDLGFAAGVHAHGITTALLANLAGPETGREQLLAEAMTADSVVAFGLTESSGGSDARAMGTRATRDGTDWIIQGGKEFITNSGLRTSRAIILFARTDAGSEGQRPEISSFLVPLDAPGVVVAPAYDKIGWRSSDTHPVFFDDVRVPAEALLGHVGGGLRAALGFLTWARLPMAAMGVGVAQGCVESTLSFVGDRKSFGLPLAHNQGVAFAVADMMAQVSSARLVTYDACFRYDRGLPFEQQAAICKLVSTELANRVTYKATQLHGANGVVVDSRVTRHYGDARVLTIGEGTSEVQRLLLARSVGLPL